MIHLKNEFHVHWRFKICTTALLYCDDDDDDDADNDDDDDDDNDENEDEDEDADDHEDEDEDEDDECLHFPSYISPRSLYLCHTFDLVSYRTRHKVLLQTVKLNQCKEVCITESGWGMVLESLHCGPYIRHGRDQWVYSTFSF